MKIVIDISEEFYDVLTNEYYDSVRNTALEHLDLVQKIKNGTLLEEELEKIKNEIQGLIDFEESCCGDITLGYQCLGVIEDIISELKGENKK